MLQSIFSRKNLLVLFILSAVNMFAFILFSRQIMMAVEAAGSFLLLFIIILYQVFNDENVASIKRNFSVEVNLLLAGVILSMPMAYIFHHQNFAITFYAQKFTYFFLFYYLLHYFGTSSKQLEDLIFWFGMTWTLIFFAQYFAYPNIILNSRVDLDRGTIRIFFPGWGIAVIAYFLSLQKALTQDGKIRYIIYLLLFFIAGGILQGTRQMLATLVLLSGMFIVFNRHVQSKGLIIFMSIIIAGALVMVFYDFFIGMLSVTEHQSLSPEEPIRVRSARFFLTEFMESPVNYILGNGADHGSSPYGREIIYYKGTYGFYQSDIGIIGDYSKFGSLYVIGELIIIFRMIFGRKPEGLAWLKYFFGLVLLTVVVGSGFFSSGSVIIGIAMLLYLYDKRKSEEELIITDSESE